ncbi:MAG TPA: S24 family peptidase [Bacteroidia bacterium]|nr:S24 family peptidase [Bacteroidia bacterium]
METFNSRYKALARKKGLSLQDISQRLNMTYQNLNRLLTASDIKFSQVERLAKAIDEPVNTLLDILSKRHIPEKEGKHYQEVEEIRNEATDAQIPFYNVDVTASAFPVFADEREEPEYFISIPAFKDCDFAVPIYGDSMYPKIKNGHIVAVKEVKNKTVILYGEIYLVITEDYRTVKYIRKHPGDISKVLLCSENPSFDDVEISRDSIIRLFKVRGQISINVN